MRLGTRHARSSSRKRRCRAAAAAAAKQRQPASRPAAHLVPVDASVRVSVGSCLLLHPSLQSRAALLQARQRGRGRARRQLGLQRQRRLLRAALVSCGHGLDARLQGRQARADLGHLLRQLRLVRLLLRRRLLQGGHRLIRHKPTHRLLEGSGAGQAGHHRGLLGLLVSQGLQALAQRLHSLSTHRHQLGQGLLQPGLSGCHPPRQLGVVIGRRQACQLLLHRRQLLLQRRLPRLCRLPRCLQRGCRRQLAQGGGRLRLRCLQRRHCVLQGCGGAAAQLLQRCCGRQLGHSSLLLATSRLQLLHRCLQRRLLLPYGLQAGGR